MIVQKLKDAWSDFFFAPISPLPLGTFRILYGLCVCGTLALLHSDWLSWFGVHSWIKMETMQLIEPEIRLNLFSVIPQNDSWILALFWLFFIASIFLTVGLWTRVSSIIVFLGLTSMNERMPFIIHGGDTFLRIAGFFLIFAPAGQALSIDLLRRKRRRGTSPAPESLFAPWAQRLIQYQIAVIYFISFWWKAKGHSWWDGTALYYVLHLREIQRFPIPNWVQHPAVYKLGSWATLGFELLFPLAVWFKRFRYPLLFAGLLFHLCLEYSLNVPMFEWDILSAYVLFVEPEDLKRIFARLARRWQSTAQRTSTGEVAGRTA
jgi:hypothetical protein